MNIFALQRGSLIAAIFGTMLLVLPIKINAWTYRVMPGDAAGAKEWQRCGYGTVAEKLRLVRISNKAYKTGRISNADLAFAIKLLNTAAPGSTRGCADVRYASTMLLLAPVRTWTSKQRRSYLRAVEPLLTSPTAPLRAMAAHALGQLRDPRNRRLLRPLLADKDKNVRMAASAAYAYLENTSGHAHIESSKAH